MSSVARDDSGEFEAIDLVHVINGVSGKIVIEHPGLEVEAPEQWMSSDTWVSMEECQ